MVYIADSSDEWQDNVGRFFGGEAKNNAHGMARLWSDVEAATNIKNNLETAKNDMKSKGFYTAKSGSGNFKEDTTVNVWGDINKYKKSRDYEDDLRRYLYTINGFSQQDELYRWILERPNHKVDLEFSPNFWTSILSKESYAKSYFYGIGFIAGLVDKIADAKVIADLENAKLDKLVEWVGGESQANKIANYRMKCDKYIWNAANGSTAQGNTQDLIANLGYFFKKTAYVYNTETTTDEDGNEVQEVTGWRASKLSVTGALLYAIFIFQSCMYLIMYVKRLFYVIMLSMFGPIVVIYDFFMKSAS